MHLSGLADGNAGRAPEGCRAPTIRSARRDSGLREAKVAERPPGV
jgi:hypothetical protein